MSILSWQPHLLSKCLDRVSSEVQSWEPVQASTDYRAVVAYLIRLLDTVSIDSRSKSSLRGMSAGSRTGELPSDPPHTSSYIVDSAKRPAVHESGVVTTMLQSWLPRGLTKRSLSKMVFHADAQLQTLGLQLLHALLQRMARAVAESGLLLRNHPWLELTVNACLQNVVPDFQSIAGLRSKLLRLKQRHPSDLFPIDDDDEVGGGGGGSCELVGLGVVEDDFDFNVEEPVETRAAVASSAAVEEVPPSAHLLSELLLQVVEDYIAVCPQSVAQSRFDVVRLLDDYLPWEQGVSVPEAQQSAAMQSDGKVLLCILRIFRQSLLAQAEIRWFGGREDSVKTIINIIVAEDWRHAMKRSVLMKLMLLALPAASDAAALHEEVAHKARSLLKSVLIQSGLFAGHGVVDAELSLELEAWMQTLSAADDSLFVLDILLRLSFHWNSSLAIHDELELGDSDVDSTSSRGPLLYSPVLYCAALLAHTNFHLFACDLPKYIRDHLSAMHTASDGSSISGSGCGSFFHKYRSTCRLQVEAALLRVLVRVVGTTSDPARYCADLLAAPFEESSNGDGCFYQTVHSCKQLMSALGPNNSSAVDPPWNLIAGCKQTLSIVFMGGIKSSTIGSRKKVHQLHAADADEMILHDANFPFSCSLVLSNWEAVQRIVCSIDAVAAGPRGVQGVTSFHEQLTSFLRTHWRVVLLLQLQEKGSAMLLSADYVHWITARWTEDYCSHHQKLSTHIKSLLVLFVVKVMKALTQFIGNHDLTVVVTAAGDPLPQVVVCPASDSVEGRSPFASLMAPFCQAIVCAAASWTSNVSMITQLCAADYHLAVRHDWLGQVYRLLLAGTSSVIVRRMRQAANTQSVYTTMRITRLHRDRDKLSPSLDSKVAEWWQNIAGLLIAGYDSQVFAGAMGCELLSLARTVIQIVDSPQLYKLVVNRTTTTIADDDDDNDELLTSLTLQLPHKMMQLKALRRHPVVVAVGGIIEDTLRSLLPRTMVSSICAAINSGSLCKQSGGTSSHSSLSALSVVTFKVDHSSSTSGPFVEYFMDPASFLSFGSTASHYSSMSPQQFLSLRWDCYQTRNSFMFIHDKLSQISMQLVHILATQVHLPHSLLRSDDPSAALVLAELLITPQLQVGASSDAIAMIAAEGPAVIASIVGASPRPLFDRCFSLVQLIGEALQCDQLLINFLAFCVQSRRERASPAAMDHQDCDGPSMGDDDDDALDLARADDYPVVVIFATKLAIERAARSIDSPPLAACIDLWCASYLTATSYLLDRGIECLQLVDQATSVLSSSAQELKRILSMLSLMLRLSSESSVSAAMRAALPTMEAAALKKKLNKFMRAAVKCGIEQEFVLTWLSKMMTTLFSMDSPYSDRRRGRGSSSSVLLQYVLLPGASDFYAPSTLLKLVPMHSKFESLLLLAPPPLEGDGAMHRTSAVAYCTKHALLQLVLVLLLVVVERGEMACLCDPDDHMTTDQYHLANVVMCSYAATLSESDRLSLRILTILADHNQCPPLCCLVPRMPLHIQGLNGRPRLRSPQELLDASSRWILQEGINPKIVYSSLTKFPLWRSLRPQAYGWERSLRTSSSDTIKSSVAFSSAKCSDAWRHGCAGEEDSYSHTDVDTDGFGDIESVEASQEHDEALPKWDPCLHYSQSSLDPSFLMPLLLFVLRNREVSVRQLANSGALSMIVASLGSACSAMRTYALACLHHVDAMIHRQTPTKDPAFRERSQLTLLLSYIKNAVDPGDDHHDAGTALRLPVTTAIFLGRAAMNVMQPGHELYGKVNKFMLARPYCDVKDVPLFDLLMVNGDNQSDQSQRLAALRLFRDGLLTRRDHLNFCRKNAYSRLMMLFPLIAKDTRAGHAVLDLIDRALCMKASARYLLERCQLTAWIKLHASPMSAMQLPARQDSGTTSSSSYTCTYATPIGTEQKSHYSKYLVRSLTILRRIVASSYLLAAEDSVQVIEGLHLIVISTIQDACTAISCGYHDAIPLEYFQQLLLCMWDLQMCAAAALGRGSRSLWDLDLLHDLYESMQSKLSALNVSNASSSALEEHKDLLFSLSGLLLHVPIVGMEETSKLDKVSFLLYRLTSLLVKHVLQHVVTSDQSSVRVNTATAYGIILPIALDQLSSTQCSIDSTLRTDSTSTSTVRVDGNYANLSECMFPSGVLPIVDAQPSSQFEYAWVVLSTIDLTCLNCLPACGASGKSFAVFLAVKLLSSYWHAVSSAYFLDNCCDELALMRWCLLVRTMFLRHCSISETHSYHYHSLDRSGLGDGGCIRGAGTQEALLNESPCAPLEGSSSPACAVRLSEVLCKLWLRITAPERRTYYHAVLSQAQHFASYAEPLMAAAAVLKDLQSSPSTRDASPSRAAAVDQLTSHVFDWFSLLVSAVDNNCLHAESSDPHRSAHSINELLGTRSELIGDFAISLRNELTDGGLPLSKSPSHRPSDMEVFAAGVISDLDGVVGRRACGSLDGVGLTYMPHRDYRHSAKRRKEFSQGASTASSAVIAVGTSAASMDQTETELLPADSIDAVSTVVGKRKLSSIGRRFVRSKRL